MTGIAQQAWRLVVHPVTFVAICLLWCLDLGLGSLLAYRRPDLFGAMDAYPFATWLREVGARALPWSAWVYLLAALTWAMTASLALCTVNWLWKRRRMRKSLGEVLVHLGFLLIFCGFVAEAVFGTRVHGVLAAPGEESEIAALGLSLRLEKLGFTVSPDGEVLDTVSTLAVRGPAGSAAGVVRLNNPLIAGSIVVYPRGFQQTIVAALLRAPGGALRLGPGDSAELPDGRRLALLGVLQPEQQSGGLRGPAVEVGLTGPTGRLVQSAVLQPARGADAANLDGVPVVLGGLDDRRHGRYDVHRDPGVRFVLLGAVLLFAGSLWAFGTYLAAAGPRQSPAWAGR